MKRVIKSASRRKYVNIPEAFIGNKAFRSYNDEERSVIAENAEKLADYLEDVLSTDEGVDAEVEYFSSNSGKTLGYYIYFNGEKIDYRYGVDVKLEKLLDYEPLVAKILKSKKFKSLVVIRDSFLEFKELKDTIESAPLAQIFKNMYKIPGDVSLGDDAFRVRYSWEPYQDIPTGVNLEFRIGNYRPNYSNIVAKSRINMQFGWGAYARVNDAQFKDVNPIEAFAGFSAEDIIAECAEQYDPTAAISNLNRGLDYFVDNLSNDTTLKVFGSEYRQTVDVRVDMGTRHKWVYIDWEDIAKSPNAVIDAINDAIYK